MLHQSKVHHLIVKTLNILNFTITSIICIVVNVRVYSQFIEDITSIFRSLFIPKV